MGVFERQKSSSGNSVNSFLQRKREEETESGVFERSRIEEENRKIEEVNAIAQKYGVSPEKILEWSKKYNLKTIDKSLERYMYIMSRIDKAKLINVEVSQTGEIVSGQILIEGKPVATINEGTVNVYKVGVLELNLELREKLNTLVTRREAQEKKYAREYGLKSAGNVYKEAREKGLSPEEAKKEVERVTGRKESISVLEKMAETTKYKTKKEKEMEKLKEKSGEVFRKTYEAEKYIKKREEGYSPSEAYSKVEEEVPGENILSKKEAEEIFVNYSKEKEKKIIENKEKTKAINEQYKLYFELRFNKGKSSKEAYQEVLKRFGRKNIMSRERLESYFKEDIEKAGGGYYSPESAEQIRETLLNEGYSGYTSVEGEDVLFKIETKANKVLNGLVKATIDEEIVKENIMTKEDIMEELKKEYLSRGHTEAEWKFNKDKIYELYRTSIEASREYNEGLRKYQEKYAKHLVDLKDWLNEQASVAGRTVRDVFKLEQPEDKDIVSNLEYQKQYVGREAIAFISGEFLAIPAQVADISATFFAVVGTARDEIAIKNDFSAKETITVLNEAAKSTAAASQLFISTIATEPQTVLAQTLIIEGAGIGLGRLAGKAKAKAFAREFIKELGEANLYIESNQIPTVRESITTKIGRERRYGVSLERPYTILHEKGVVKSSIESYPLINEGLRISTTLDRPLHSYYESSGWSINSLTKRSGVISTKGDIIASGKLIKEYLGKEKALFSISGKERFTTYTHSTDTGVDFTLIESKDTYSFMRSIGGDEIKNKVAGVTFKKGKFEKHVSSEVLNQLQDEPVYPKDMLIEPTKEKYVFYDDDFRVIEETIKVDSKPFSKETIVRYNPKDVENYELVLRDIYDESKFYPRHMRNPIEKLTEVNEYLMRGEEKYPFNPEKFKEGFGKISRRYRREDISLDNILDKYNKKPPKTYSGGGSGYYRRTKTASKPSTTESKEIFSYDENEVMSADMFKKMGLKRARRPSDLSINIDNEVVLEKKPIKATKLSYEKININLSPEMFAESLKQYQGIIEQSEIGVLGGKSVLALRGNIESKFKVEPRTKPRTQIRTKEILKEKLRSRELLKTKERTNVKTKQIIKLKQNIKTDVRLNLLEKPITLNKIKVEQKLVPRQIIKLETKVKPRTPTTPANIATQYDSLFATFPFYIKPSKSGKKKKKKKEKKKKEVEFRNPDLFGKMFKVHKDISYKGILPRNPKLVGETIVKPKKSKRKKKRGQSGSSLEKDISRIFEGKKKKR